MGGVHPAPDEKIYRARKPFKLRLWNLVSVSQILLRMFYNKNYFDDVIDDVTWPRDLIWRHESKVSFWNISSSSNGIDLKFGQVIHLNKTNRSTSNFGQSDIWSGFYTPIYILLTGSISRVLLGRLTWNLVRMFLAIKGITKKSFEAKKLIKNDKIDKKSIIIDFYRFSFSKFFLSISFIEISILTKFQVNRTSRTRDIDFTDIGL